MASMEDLVATVSGSMHVSQERYDLQNFRVRFLSTGVIVLIEPGDPLWPGC